MDNGKEYLYHNAKLFSAINKPLAVQCISIHTKLLLIINFIKLYHVFLDYANGIFYNKYTNGMNGGIWD